MHCGRVFSTCVLPPERSNMVKAPPRRASRSLLVRVTNGVVAARLDEAADLLGRQGANEFRVRAYRRGAETLRGMVPPCRRVLGEQASKGLMRLPGIGESLARAIEQLVDDRPHADSWSGCAADAEPARIFTTVADIGTEAGRADPRRAGHRDARGARRRRAGTAGCARAGHGAEADSRRARVACRTIPRRRRERRRHKRRSRRRSIQPPVGELLDIDEEYRRLAERDRLIRVAPRRFNPEGQAWLPILHTERGGRRYTAMFSNTGRAHELGATHDWVVIYREDKAAQRPVDGDHVAAGRLKGRRVVRGARGRVRQAVVSRDH